MAQIQQRVWGKKPGAANGNNNDAWTLNVKFAQYTKNGNLAFKLSGFKFTDIQPLNKLFDNSIFYFNTNKQGTVPYLFVKPNKIEEFKKLIPSLESELKKLGHYSDDSIDSFGEKLEKAILTAPTEEEIKANQENIIGNWKKLLETLNNPETKKKFLAFQTSYVCYTTLKDAALSPSNVIEVSLADPQATFVTDAATWKTKFHHTVNPGAPFVIINKPEQTVPVKYLERDPVVIKNGGWWNLCKKCGGPWYGEAWAAQKRVKKQNNLPTTFFKAKVYDVRFTTPDDPNNDPFVKIVGLVNNLTGEINQAAKELAKIEAMKNGEATPDFNTKREGIQTSEDLLKYKDFILAKCASKKISIPEIGSTEDIIANAIYAYAYNIAESYNVLSDKGNKGKMAFASAVLYSVAYSINLKASKVSQAVNIFDGLSKEQAEEVVQKTYEVYKQIASHNLYEDKSEDESVLSYDEYHNLIMDLLPNKEKVKKEFDDFNNRMNNI